MYRFVGLSLFVFAVACSESTDSSIEDGSEPDASDDGDAGEVPDRPDAQAPSHEVECIDQSISSLMLLDEPATDSIQDDADQGDYFETLVDATGGGLTPTTSYVYVRFTRDGIEQVEISDED